MPASDARVKERPTSDCERNSQMAHPFGRCQQGGSFRCSPTLPSRAELVAAGTCTPGRDQAVPRSIRLGRVGLRENRAAESKRIGTAKSDMHPQTARVRARVSPRETSTLPGGSGNNEGVSPLFPMCVIPAPGEEQPNSEGKQRAHARRSP